MDRITVGTRRSRLARIQTEIVTNRLVELFPFLEIMEKIIVTKGDKILDVPLAQIGDKGLFTREIEKKLLDGDIDYAVHSYKDLPTELPDGLMIGAVLERESPEDALVAAKGTTLENLAPGAKIGTSSLRRKAQLLRLRPDVTPVEIRGNVNTRIDKLDAGEYDAILLAAAGMRRMGYEARIAETLDFPRWYHAVGQGAIAIEVREDDWDVKDVVHELDHNPTRLVTDAERAFLARLEGGCQVPVGVSSRIDGQTLHFAGMVASLDGKTFITGEIEDLLYNASDIGKRLADELLEKGAGAVLERIRKEEQ